MLHATELLGAEAYDAQGIFVGRVTELFIEPADQPNRVARLLLGREKYQPLVVRYDQVGFVAPGTVRLIVEEGQLEHYRPNEAWLAVQKDLLDQQIIDTNGRKVVRVNDIDLAEQRTNGTVELRVTLVDVGLTGAVRRLLQGLAPPSVIRRIQQKLPTKQIQWEFVNLIEPDPLRRVKLRITHQKLERLHPADLADIMEELSPAERESIIASVDDETAAEALAELDARLTAQIVEKMDPEKAADIIEEMEPDAAADVLAGLTPEASQEVLSEMPREEAQEVRELLEFDESTAGGMMNSDFVLVGEAATRDEVVEWIRGKDVNLEQVDTVIVIDGQARLSGVVAVARLLLAGGEQALAELKSEPLVSVRAEAEEKEVFELFDKYNLRSLSVVDEDGRPMGSITVDDVVTRLCKRN
ncbi:MAG TPA: CBS domain-containing protein [Candidatus Acidoferrales bacterium]|nr:CBS domain-containing protein [Candidatus Acidoferrales bacterium]